MEEKGSDTVGVTLYPADYEAVEMVTDQGKEILQQEFTEAQLFLHSIQELERVRTDRKKKKMKTEDVDDEQDNEVKTEDTDESMETAETVEKLEETVEDADEEEDVIDPRIHYRPMVAELQAAVAELHQLINSIDLIRRRDFLEEMRCIRENTAPKREELEHLVEAKQAQVKESGAILLDGVEALAKTVEKESVFFQGITQMLRKWKICAPIHGNIPKPFRAGEPLAVDCSYGSAGSFFVPQTRSIADLAYAELSRTEKGLVRVKTPEDFLARAIQIKLEAKDTGKEGAFTLPSPHLVPMTKAEMDKLEDTPEDLKTLEERNVSILKAVQFSVFCEELFCTLMKEALQNTSKWTDTAYNISKYAVKKHGRDDSSTDTHISVLHVLDDEIQLRVNERYHLTIKLVDVKSLSKNKDVTTEEKKATEEAANGEQDVVDVKEEPLVEDAPVPTSSPGKPRRAASISYSTPADSDEAFLTQTCRYTLLLLQQEIRTRHGRKDISRALLYTGSDISTTSGGGVNSSNSGAGAAGMGPASETDKHDNTPGTLATVLTVLAHNLLKNEVGRYLDEVSSVLAFQKLQSSASGRVLDDGLLQPICDSVRGVYVSPRWKTCAFDSTLSAFDLNVGKNFSTEVLISGARILLQTGMASQREVSGVEGLREFVETTVCSQVALALHHDALSFGLKQSSMNLDRTSVRLVVAGEWDGSCIGEGRVSDARAVGSIFLEPYFAADGSLAINCLLQAVDASKLAPVQATLCRSASGEVHKVEWKRIPGSSDAGKMLWLMQKTGVLSEPFKGSTKSKTALSNGN
ncbi:Subunit 17 of Mediator complex [Phytophthora infestans]|uniref:Subunit 17 of Mediator complex n=1 Tax=Phytophthora infestans TaxID=4787 RepID=A0A833SYL6_PHYIN|nr:Subunit 17 of Mediator complex [Phytophthora infestans]